MVKMRWRVAAAAAVAVVGAAGSASAQESSRWTSESDWDIPGEYVVDFRDDVSTSGVSAVLGALGVPFRATALESETRIQIVSLDAANVSRVLRALEGDGRIERVEPHARVRTMFVPDDPMYGEQWHLRRVGSEDAWGGSVGRGVTVAVIDTGIACETVDDFNKVTDLGDTKCVAGWNFVKNNSRASDDHGHGTHVAGTIAQSTNNGHGVAGLAFRAQLMPVKVLSADGFGTTSSVADGIRWAADHGAHVINLSLGGPRNSFILQSAVAYARSKGSVVVAAAGNSGGRVGYPGGSAGVIGVGATDANDGVAWFSSRGKGVDVAAPGVNVMQQTVCDRGKNRCEMFKAFNGTSMASPHVAAAAALLVSMGVSRGEVIEEYLQHTAKKLDADPDGKLFGAGLMQVQDAVSHAGKLQLLARVLGLLAVMALAFRWAKKKGTSVRASSPALWLGALVTGTGLFFLPWLAPRHSLWVDWLARPFGEWDMMIGASLHSFLPLAHVGIPLAFGALLLSVRRAVPLVAGVAIGTGGYLASVATLGQLGTSFGWFFTTLWCALNALGCAYLASLMLQRKPA